MRDVSIGIVCGLTLTLFCTVGGASIAAAEVSEDKQMRQVAVTFDDLPSGGGSLALDELQAMTEKLLAAITEHGVPAVGFVNEGKLYQLGEVDERIATLVAWLDAGLELGNHTFSHPSFHDTPLVKYKEDVIRGETVTRRLVREREGPSSELRWFRHPYLRTGRSLADKLSFESFLSARGYTVAPVTLENHDYIYAALYRRALKADDQEMAGKVARAYLDFTFELVAFHDAAAETVFGRPIRHVLLLHANELNGDHFGAMAARFKAEGYGFATLEHVLEDPAYGTQDRYVGPAGVNWIFRWDQRLNASGGLAVDWSEEPRVQPWIQEAFDNR